MKKFIIAFSLVFMLGMVPGGGSAGLGFGCEICGPGIAEAAVKNQLRNRFVKQRRSSRKSNGSAFERFKNRFLNPQWTYRYANKRGFHDTTPVPFKGIYEQQYRKYYVNR